VSTHLEARTLGLAAAAAQPPAPSRAEHALQKLEASGLASAERSPPPTAGEAGHGKCGRARPSKTACLKQFLVIIYYRQGSHKKLEPYRVGPASLLILALGQGTKTANSKKDKGFGFLK